MFVSPKINKPMKRSLSAIFLLTIALVACKKKEDPAPYPGIERLMGKWRLVAYETIEKEERVWKEIEGEGRYEFMVRYDGVILNQEGLPACCVFPYYFINGVRFEVVPGEPVKENPQCALIDCLFCEEVNYDLREDGSLFSYCGPSGLKQKFERL